MKRRIGFQWEVVFTTIAFALAPAIGLAQGRQSGPPSWPLPLPHGWVLGQTTRSAVVAQKIPQDPYANRPNESIYRIEQRVIVWVSNVTDLVTAVKFYKMPEQWRRAGVSEGMPRSKYLALMTAAKASCWESAENFGWSVECNRGKLHYWASFPNAEDTEEPRVALDTLQFAFVSLVSPQ